MKWFRSHRMDPAVRGLADRHYNRQSEGHPNIAPPGRLLVLKTLAADALWVTCWQKPEYVKHAWPNAWTCSTFRNEGPHLSSLLIRQAVARTVHKYGPPPAGGMITFVDPSKVRHKRDPGRCFLHAGFRVVGKTPKGLICLHLAPADMPAPEAPAILGNLRRIPLSS